MNLEEANIEHTKAQTRLLNAQAAEIESRLAGAAPKSLASDIPAKTSKKKVEAPAPAAAPTAPAATPSNKEAEEVSKKLALDTASAYVRHFSKSAPDGMVRARNILGEKFSGKKIAELTHEERLKFVEALKAEMVVPGAAA